MRARQTLGWNVRRLRVERNWSIEELAGVAEIDASYVARIERGTVNASIDVVEKIALALKLRPMELLVEDYVGAKAPRPLRAGRRPRR